MTVEAEGSAAPDGAADAGTGTPAPVSPPDGGDEKGNAETRRATERATAFARENKELKDRVALLEKQHREVAEERDQLKTTVQSVTNKGRDSEILRRLSTAQGLQVTSDKLELSYRGLIQVDGLDPYPEDVVAAAKEREALLRQKCPELFGDGKPPTTGGSPPGTGRSTPAKKPGDWAGW